MHKSDESESLACELHDVHRKAAQTVGKLGQDQPCQCFLWISPFDQNKLDISTKPKALHHRIVDQMANY